MIKNILVLSYSDTRGDGIAAYNISKYLLDAGFDVSMFVIQKTRNDSFITCYEKKEDNSLRVKIVNKVRRRLIKKELTETVLIDKKFDFFLDQEKATYVSAKNILENISFTPQLVLVGSMHDLVNTSTLREINSLTGAHIYMLMFDMYPITGGCQHAWNCKGYQNNCSDCPAILNDALKQKPSENLMIKHQNIKEAKMNIIACSGRTLKQAQSSFLFRDNPIIHNINGFVDTDIFHNRNRTIAKAIFDLPLNSKVFFLGIEHSHNERKGITYFLDAINIYWRQLSDVERNATIVLIAGKSVDQSLLDRIPFKKRSVGFITDDRLLSLAYQAADIFICSSVEDPGPITVSQALACGTPVAGFDMGVLTNLVINNVNGYKAQLRDSEDLAVGFEKILELGANDFEKLSINAVDTAKKYSSKDSFLEIIKEICLAKVHNN